MEKLLIDFSILSTTALMTFLILFMVQKLKYWQKTFFIDHCYEFDTENEKINYHKFLSLMLINFDKKQLAKSVYDE